MFCLLYIRCRQLNYTAEFLCLLVQHIVTRHRTFLPIQNFGVFFIESFAADRRIFFRSSRCRFVSNNCFDSDFFCSKTISSFLFLSTHADRANIYRYIVYSALLLYCLCFLHARACTVTDFSAKDKTSGVTFCTAVHRRPRQKITIFL